MATDLEVDLPLLSSPPIVVSLERGACEVRLPDGQLVACALSNDLAQVQRTAVAPGDAVVLQQREDAPPLVIEVLPRRSTLSRPDPMDPRLQRVLAANIDLVLIVSSAKSPAFKPGLVDRALVAVQAGDSQPVIVVTKVDLLDPRKRAALEAELLHYRELGVEVHLVSTVDGEGIEALRQCLVGKVSTVVGHSGVGKSSLLNALQGTETAAVGRVRQGDGKGRHTTTRAELHELPGGGFLIDTPGVRAFGLWGLDLDLLREVFPDLPTTDCRYDDCKHQGEPEVDCAIKRGLSEGRIPAARYRTWLRLLAEIGPPVR